METEILEQKVSDTQPLDRLIGHIKGSKPGATIIFTAGIHGNEPSGVQALEIVFEELEKIQSNIRGSIYGIRGNLAALAKKVRFIDEDLNRVWVRNRMNLLDELDAGSSEFNEQQVLWEFLTEIMENEEGPFYFFDLHTTSCQTIPFLTVNDTILNRKFTSQYPAPVILGIEEYLEGPLLSYVNELGYVAFGYEGGQHDDPQAVINHADFIRLTVCFTENVRPEDINHSFYYNRLKEVSVSKHRFYEIYDYQPVTSNDKFEMTPGYRNFQRVLEGEILAKLNGDNIVAVSPTNILMPLYQQQGDDGFFFVRKVPKFFLYLSTYLRKASFLMTLLPGVKWNDSKKENLLVNERITRFFARQLFHLFGFRSKKLSGKYWLMHNREKNSRNRDYKKAAWFQ